MIVLKHGELRLLTLPFVISTHRQTACASLPAYTVLICIICSALFRNHLPRFFPQVHECITKVGIPLEVVRQVNEVITSDLIRLDHGVFAACTAVNSGHTKGKESRRALLDLLDTTSTSTTPGNTIAIHACWEAPRTSSSQGQWAPCSKNATYLYFYLKYIFI